jgi:cell division control protein 6
MDNKWLDAIIEKVDKEQKQSPSKSAFDTSILPSKVIGRQTEVEKLVRHLSGFKDGHVVPLVSIFGRSGTGKSTLVKHVCKYIPGIKLCFVNLRKAKTVFGGVNLILNSLGQPSLKSAQGMNVAMEKIQQEILNASDKKTKMVVLALDEFDVLFYDKRGNPSDFVYKLVEMQSELKEMGCLFMIITISNNVLTDYDLDERIRSRIGNSEIFFRPYSKEDILEILKIRAKDAFTKDVDPKVLEYCANLSFLEHGDARRAVDLLRVASEIAVQNKKEISIVHIKAASARIQKDRVEDVIKTLSYHSKVACLALAKKTFGLDKPWHSTADLYEGYKRILEGDPVSYRRFSELLKDLENTGILDSDTRSRGQKGYKTEFTLLVLPELVGNAIDKEWWEKNVVEKKKSLELPFSTDISKNDPVYKRYLELKRHQDESW